MAPMFSMKILIMGLPGSGKTTLAECLVGLLETRSTVTWLNADKIREEYNDWDFSNEGRVRQSIRMRDLADSVNTDHVICDFVAPLQVMRDNFDADLVIYMDTIKSGRFEDTNKLFELPIKSISPVIVVIEQDCHKWARIIEKLI